jgi:hypothetical protein
MYLYKIDIPTTGKSYIGQTIKPVKKRFKEHCNPKNNSLISKVIRVHGGATYITLYKASSKEELNRVELDAIRRFNTEYPNGYNLVAGPGSDVAIPEEVNPKKKKQSGGRINNSHLPPIHIKTVGNIMFMTQAIKEKNTYLKHVDPSVIKGTLRHGIRSLRSGTYHLSGSYDWLPYIENIIGPCNHMSSHNIPVKCWTVTKETYDMMLNRVLSDFNN